jgi:TolB-like protein
MSSFWDELKRRNVVRVGIAYALVAYVGLQAIDFALEIIDAPHWILQVIALLVAIGFPTVLVFAWVYEMTPEGLKREVDVDRSQSIAPHTARKLDRVIISILAVAVVVLGGRQFLLPGGEAPLPQTAEKGPASIAVLPFEDYSEDKDQEYFSKGIAEEILNLLAKTNALRVAARTSSFAFASHDSDIRDIGRKLDVSTVLEGSIRKAGPMIRITAQLIDVESGYHLWSETYDREYTDIFKIQDEIASSIIDSLKVHLLDGETKQLVSERAANVEAYSAYLIGKERMALRTEADIKAGRDQFEKALLIDPDFAPAHVQLAHAWLLLEQERFGGKDMDKKMVDAVVDPHLARALALAPELPEAIAVKGYQHLRRFRYEDAARAFDKAIALNSNYALAYNWRADTAYEQGQYLEMLADKERAYALDPMSLEISADLAYEYRSFWRPEDANRVINRMFDLHPDHPLAYEAAMSNLDAMGHEAEAALLAEKALAAHPGNNDFKDWKAWELAEIGLSDYVFPLGIDEASFMAYMIEGRHDEARALLDKHMAEEKPGWRWMYNARLYYHLVEGPAGKAKSGELMTRSIALMDAENIPWRDHCQPYFADDLQRAGYKEEAEEILDVCRKRYEQRLEAKYLCPCEWFGLVMFTILDEKPDLAVQRAEKWFSDGDSSAFLVVNPVFQRLAHRPEYGSLLARNEAEIKREQEIFLAGTTSPPPNKAVAAN